MRNGAVPSVGLKRLSEIKDDSTCRSKSLHVVGILSQEWMYSSIELVDSSQTLRTIVFENNRRTYLEHLKKRLTPWLPDSVPVDSLFDGFIQRSIQADTLIETKYAVPVVDVIRMTIEMVEFVTRSVCPEQDKHDGLFFLLTQLSHCYRGGIYEARNLLAKLLR